MSTLRVFVNAEPVFGRMHIKEVKIASSRGVGGWEQG